MTRKQKIYDFLLSFGSQNGYTAAELAEALGLSRANVSADLNVLYRDALVEKFSGRPVRYAARVMGTGVEASVHGRDTAAPSGKDGIFESFIGYNGSCKLELEKAKAGLLYPPNGLPMLIVGETGTGKTTLVHMLFEYAKDIGKLPQDAEFVSFNCADYAFNQQLLMAQLFGYVKGAFTGAVKDHPGLVEKADGGMLFLDEVHRLPFEAQEMLFSVMDFGHFSRMGEGANKRQSRPLLVMATTETVNTHLLETFRRRIPINITMPSLMERNVWERLQLIEQCFKGEAAATSSVLHVDALVIKCLLTYKCPGNVGQLKNDVKIICADAYARAITGGHKDITVTVQKLPPHIKNASGNVPTIYSDIDLVVTDFIFYPEKQRKADYNALDIYAYLSRYLTLFIDDKNTLSLLSSPDSYLSTLEEAYQDTAEGSLSDSLPEVQHMTELISELLYNEYGEKWKEPGFKLFHMLMATTIQRIRRNDKIVCPFLPWIMDHRQREFELAQQILSIAFPDEGKAHLLDTAGFVAGYLFLMRQEILATQKRCVILLIYRGQSARSIAYVVNEVLGRDYVQWLSAADGVLNETSLHIMESILQKNGGLVFCDDDEICGWASQIEKKLKVPVFSMSNVPLAVIIEAGIAAYELYNTPKMIYDRLQHLLHSMSQLQTKENKKEFPVKHTARKKKAIITVCVSGLGMAIRIKRLLEKRYQLPDDLEVIALDVFSAADLRQRIMATKESYEVFCIVGFEVGMDFGIPFISASDFVIGTGDQYFLKIMKAQNISVYPKTMVPLKGKDFETSFIRANYIENYLHYLNGDTLTPYVEEMINIIETQRGKFEAGKRITLLVHICCMVERLLFEPQPPQNEEESRGRDVKMLPLLRMAANTLLKTYRIQIPLKEYRTIEQIIDTVYNE